jgi:hypothetical protein
MEPFKSNDIIFGDGIDSTEFKKMELKKRQDRFIQSVRVEATERLK